jgi:hypothetical protein
MSAECTTCGHDIPDDCIACGHCDYGIEKRIQCVLCGKKYAVTYESGLKCIDNCNSSPHGKHDFQDIP